MHLRFLQLLTTSIEAAIIEESLIVFCCFSSKKFMLLLLSNILSVRRISVFIAISMSSLLFIFVFVFISVLEFIIKVWSGSKVVEEVEEEVEEGSCRVDGKLIGIDADVSTLVNNSMGNISDEDGKFENEEDEEGCKVDEDDEDRWDIFFLDLLRYGLGSREGRGISIFIANSGSGFCRAPTENEIWKKK